MKILLLAIIALISACSGGGSSSETITVDSGKRVICSGTAYYGDSIGMQVRDSGLLPGFDFYVVSGQPITGKGGPIVLDDSYCVIYIALGTNQTRDVDLATLTLLTMISGLEDKVICVLPMTDHGILIEPMRSVLIEHCPRYIDPIQLGIYPLRYDGVHLETGDNVTHYASMFMSK